MKQKKREARTELSYVPQTYLSLVRHNTYDGVHKTKQNVFLELYYTHIPIPDCSMTNTGR